MFEVAQEQILAGLAQYPCCDYPATRIDRLFGSSPKLPVLKALKLPLPPHDILRAALRYEGVLPDYAKHELACRYAEYTLRQVEEPDPRSVAAIAAKRAWLRGEIDGAALAEARAIADHVATAAAGAAAWAAARAAGGGAGAGAEAAAWAAARAAGGGAGAGAEAAAWAAAWKDLLQITINYITEQKTP